MNLSNALAAAWSALTLASSAFDLGGSTDKSWPVAGRREKCFGPWLLVTVLFDSAVVLVPVGYNIIVVAVVGGCSSYCGLVC